MTKKHYILIGSVALVVTLLSTTTLILVVKNVFEGAADKEANPYNSVPVAKILAQTTGFNGKDISQCRVNQQCLAKASQLMRQANQLSLDKDYQGAIDIYNESLDCLKSYPGLDCIQAVATLTDKARCEEKLGLKAEREKTLQMLIEIASQTYNDRHEQVAIALESLSDQLCDQGRHAEALPLLERAYDIRVKGAGLESGDTAYTISQLGHCNLELKNYKQADDLYNRAIAIYQKLDGDGFSESQQIARENLANSYCWQDRYKEALTLELDLLAELEKKNLGHSYYAASTLTSAATTAQRLNDQIKMHDYLSRAEKIAASLNDQEDALKSADIYKDIADAYNDDDDFKNELMARQNSLESYKKLKYPQEEDQIELAQGLVKAGSCALKLKDYGKAQDYFGQALTQARDNKEIRLKLKSNKDQIEEYLKYIEKDRRAAQDAAIKMQASELKQMLFS